MDYRDLNNGGRRWGSPDVWALKHRRKRKASRGMGRDSREGGSKKPSCRHICRYPRGNHKRLGLWGYTGRWCHVVLSPEGAPQSPSAACEGRQPLRPTRSLHYLSGLEVSGPYQGPTPSFSGEGHLHSSWPSVCTRPTCTCSSPDREPSLVSG